MGERASRVVYIAFLPRTIYADLSYKDPQAWIAWHQNMITTSPPNFCTFLSYEFHSNDVNDIHVSQIFHGDKCHI